MASGEFRSTTGVLLSGGWQLVSTVPYGTSNDRALRSASFGSHDSLQAFVTGSVTT